MVSVGGSGVGCGVGGWWGDGLAKFHSHSQAIELSLHYDTNLQLKLLTFVFIFLVSVVGCDGCGKSLCEIVVLYSNPS